MTRVMSELWKKVTQRDTARIFAQPVTEDIAPGYFDLIKHPMDLSTIKNKINKEDYENLQQFRDDIYLMINNCMTYNPPTTYVYGYGMEILSYFRKQYKQAKNSIQGESGPAISSSTRGFASEVLERSSRRIFGVNIPTREELPKKERPLPKFAPAPDQQVNFYYSSQPLPPLIDSTQSRFDLLISLCTKHKDIRDKLLLLNKYPKFIMNDIIRRMSGIKELTEEQERRINVALQSTDDSGHTGVIPMVTEAPISASAIMALAHKCPQINLNDFQPISDQYDPYMQNLRLLTFYENTMSHWHERLSIHAQKTVMEQIKQNIVQIVQGLPPASLVKNREFPIIQRYFFDGITK